MKTLPFLSRNLFLNFAFLFGILFLGSCDNVFELAPKKEKMNDPKIEIQLPDCISISPTKMNVLYIGVDNPISISAPGVPASNLKVSISGGGGGTIKKGGGSGQYYVNVNKPAQLGNECKITVEANGISKSILFRVKRIPDPMAKVGGKIGGAMGAGEFKAQGGVAAILNNFDFDAKCKIQGFILTHIRQNEKAIESSNRGPRYTDESRKLINDGKPGDIYTFHNVKAKCPGDPAGRMINSMVFKIK